MIRVVPTTTVFLSEVTVEYDTVEYDTVINTT